MGGDDHSPEGEPDDEYFGPKVEDYDLRDHLIYTKEGSYQARIKVLLDRMSLPRVLRVIEGAIKDVGHAKIYIEEEELKTILQYELPKMERKRFNDKDAKRITKGMVSNLIRLLHTSSFLDREEVDKLEKRIVYYKLTHNARDWYERL